MIDTGQLVLFIAASWILILTPGPDMIYVITRGISQGPKAGVLSAVGVILGIFVHTTFAAFGLAVILRTSAIVFSVVKYLGAGYLIYLGIKSFMEKSVFQFGKNREHKRLRVVVVQGLLSNVFNPKVALFFLAFLPQFVTPENGPVAVQMMMLGLLFAGFGLVFLVTVGYFSGAIGHWLSTRESVSKRIHWLTGSILVALGLRLVFIEHR